MLRKIRTFAAMLSIVLISLLFLDFTGILHQCLGYLAKIQFVPALFALNVGVIVSLLLLSFLFGRIYCSVLCPLGVFQDVISWLASKNKKNRFVYSPAISWLRYGFLAVFIIAFVAGIGTIVALFEPYSLYGRIASNLFAPIYQSLNNVLAYFAQRMNSYAFYSVEVWIKSSITFAIAVGTFVIIGVLAWRNGRTYCNTICPVGTVLGLVSRFSIFKPIIHTDQCNSCGLCSRNCKASCIDSTTHTIDYSRCVTCMDCIEKCNKKAINYQFKKQATSSVEQLAEKENSRRAFLSLAALFTFTAALKAQKPKVDGGLAFIEDKKVPKRVTPLKPAGAMSIRNFEKHCTACGLCISTCPNKVLSPSTNLMTLMQAEMSYERGYCRPECVQCSEVCPTGAIHKISTAEKSATQIGHAVWIQKNCVVNTDKVTCTSCFRHCPVGAIQLLPKEANNPKSLKIPIINTERCIGCGACENLCPARPFSAIYVEGHERHRLV